MGLRNRAMISGVNLIHQGPWGIPWMASRTPEWHQALIVDTFTWSTSAATLERQRPSARYPSAHADKPSGQQLGILYLYLIQIIMFFVKHRPVPDRNPS